MNADQKSEPDLLAGHDGSTTTVVIPVLQETARVERRQVEAGFVRIHKTVSEREDVVEALLMQEDLHVERVPINRIVDQAPSVREEEDILIVPVMEEVLVVEKRLMLREELRIRRNRGERTVRETVRLRTEKAVVEQTPNPDFSPQGLNAERKGN